MTGRFAVSSLSLVCCHAITYRIDLDLKLVDQ